MAQAEFGIKFWYEK